MRKSFPVLLGILFFLIISKGFTQVQGQLSNRFFANWAVGVSGGPNIFFGDLKVNKFWPASKNMNEWRFAGSFYLLRQISHVFSLRAQVLYGEISGTKRVYKDGAPCNQYFEGNILEYNLNTMINFSNLFFRYSPERKFFFYGTVGAGLSNWITKVKDLQTKQQIGGSGTASNWTTEVVVPAGLGAYYSFADKVNLGIEWTLRGVGSDKLDATVGGFQYDMYSLFSLNLTYNFNKRNPGTFKPAQRTNPIAPQPARMQLPEPKSGPEDQQVQTPIIFPPEKPDSLNTRKEINPDEKTGEQLTEEPLAPIIDSPEAAPVVPGLSFRVQVFAFSTDEYSAEAIRKRFKITQPVWKEFSDGWYRYTVGSFKTLKAADSFRQQLRAQKKIMDAFVARYKDGVRITIHAK